MPAFLAPWAAKLAGSLVGWLVILGIIGALISLWQWERHDRIAAEKGEQAARDQLASAVERANSLAGAVSSRDLAIQQRDLALNACSAETEKLGKAKSAAEIIARASAADADVARQAAEARAVELEAWVKAHPDKVCRLSPEMQDRAEGTLFK